MTIRHLHDARISRFPLARVLNIVLRGTQHMKYVCQWQAAVALRWYLSVVWGSLLASHHQVGWESQSADNTLGI